MPPAVALIVVVPTAPPVTTPAFETLAIAGSALDQTNVVPAITDPDLFVAEADSANVEPEATVEPPTTTTATGVVSGAAASPPHATAIAENASAHTPEFRERNRVDAERRSNGRGVATHRRHCRRRSRATGAVEYNLPARFARSNDAAVPFLLASRFLTLNVRSENSVTRDERFMIESADTIRLSRDIPLASPDDRRRLVAERSSRRA